MLVVLFRIGGAHYALDSAQLVEVLPRIAVEPIPQAPQAVMGTCNYRGTPVVVIDLEQLAGHAAAPPLFSTRLLLVRHGSAQLALLASRVTETVTLDPRSFEPDDSPVTRHLAWRGPRAPYGEGFVHRFDLDPLWRDYAGAA